MDCASDDEIKSFMGNYKVVMFQALHYIDHDDIEAKDGHVKSIIGDIDQNEMSLVSPPALRFTFIESQIELEHSLWQIFSEPEEITLLNIDPLSKTELPIRGPDDSYSTYLLDLSKIVKIEKRQVTSFPSLFGDITGLKDFFNFLIVIAIGGSQAKMYHFN